MPNDQILRVEPCGTLTCLFDRRMKQLVRIVSVGFRIQTERLGKKPVARLHILNGLLGERLVA